MHDERIRTTISLDAETYEVFKRLADTAGVSVSRCMGDWLTDTIEAAELATTKMLEIRRTPERSFREFLGSVADEVVVRMEAPTQRRSAAAAPRAPSSLTGLNPPGKTRKGRS